MKKRNREDFGERRHFSDGDSLESLDQEPDRYMEKRRHRTRKRRRRQTLAGFAAFSVLLLAGMGIAFRVAWLKAGEAEAPEIEEAAVLPGVSALDPGDVEAENLASAVTEENSGGVSEDTQNSSDTAPSAIENEENEILMPGEEETQSADAQEETPGADAQDGTSSSEKTEEKLSTAVQKAKHYAAQYDYDKALKVLKKEKGFDTDEALQELADQIQAEKDSCEAWPLDQVTHVFYHTLIRDPSLAFDGDSREAGYNQYMTTIDEFLKITQSMYDKGYVMVSIYDMAYLDDEGTMHPGEILLPPGKKPFVLSQDDVCYYHYMDGDGMAAKLVVDEEGRIRNTYVETDGSISVGDYDMVPLIDRFVEEHPDFSYRGAKGIVALTGYNGILGYRTDISYQTKPDDMDDNKKQWLAEHPDFDLEKERTEVKQVIDAMKAEGWLFASHTWGHLNVGEVSLDRLVADTERFQENVDPLIGGTDIIIFAFGTDLSQYDEYSGDKYEFLYGRGYRYFCNVDSSRYFVQLTEDYLRMGRRNLDGYRMYYNPDMLSDLFDVSEVFDASRPTPVPAMG